MVSNSNVEATNEPHTVPVTPNNETAHETAVSVLENITPKRK